MKKERQKTGLLEIVANFHGKKILVIGDIVADEYIHGMTSRVSREAPVLILQYDSTIVQPGCAANAIANIRAMGGTVLPVGVVGQDEMGEKLINSLERRGVKTNSILVEPGMITPAKTRILAGGQNTTKQQVIRIDKDWKEGLSRKTERKLLKEFKERFDEADAVIVSDYGLGTISPTVLKTINNLAKTDKKKIVVDSRYNMLKYRNVTAATPNTEEIEWALGISLNKNNMLETGKKVLKKLNSDSLLITKGKEGMLLLENNGSVTDMGIYGTDEVADVTGAGDTVISAFTISLAAGASTVEAAKIANYAGGIVVMKSGTATASQNEIHEAIDDL